MSVGIVSGIGIDETIIKIILAAALGLFLGLEREWSRQPAGIRTFSLISLLAALFMILDQPLLLVIGALLVMIQGAAMAIQGTLHEDRGLGLTTAVSMLVAYGVGGLVGAGFYLEAITIAVLSSLLLVLKRELHGFAWGLTRKELRSSIEFAVLAFVIYPILPAGDVEIGSGQYVISIEPRVIWLMVVTVAAIGIVNYAIVKKYGGRGVAVTGFFGGLASSTAVVGTMIDHVRRRPSITNFAVAAILLADAAMALRNLAIALAFTIQTPLLRVVPPLGAIVIGAIVLAAVVGDWGERFEFELESPFSMRNALGFGFVFLVIVVTGAIGEAAFGTAGFYLTAAIGGLVSSAGVTTSAIVLFRAGTIPDDVAVIGILLATATSILVKAGLAMLGGHKPFARRVFLYTSILLIIAGVVTSLTILLL